MKLNWIALSACSVLPFAAHAQITTARLVGTVADAQGALVKNAQVSVVDERTGVTRVVQTNDSGLYVAVSLPPSSYSVTAVAPGFSSQQLKGVILAVGQEITEDFKLPAAGADTSVTVEASSSFALETASAKIGGNVASREIENLPINGRQISQLYLLIPGATNVGAGNFDTIRFSGRAVEENIIRVDGIEADSIISSSPGNLNGELTSLFRLQQSLEAVQEFRVDSSSYPAEFGTGTGGQISFISKSGGNKIHGSAFEYLRNDAFDARNAFNLKNVVNNSPKFRLNQFGGALGGPILKDKLFGFATYEGLRQIFAVPYRQGTLSNFYRAQIPTTSPVYGIIAAFPVDPTPASAETATTIPFATVTGQNSINENFGDIRFDYHFNDKYSAYARYTRDQGNNVQIQDASLSQFRQVETTQNGVLAFNQVLTGHVFNETKFGFNAIKQRVLGVAGPSPNADLSSARISIGGLTNVGALISLSSSFNGTGAPYTGSAYSYIDNLSVVRGNHGLKFGVEIRPLNLYNNQIGGTTYTYQNPQAFVANAPSQIQFFGNLSDPSPFTGLSGNAEVRQHYYIGYAQDEWKIKPNLTFSYGLRYEYYSPLHEARNKVVVFDIPTGTIIPRDPNDFYISRKDNFGPRLGLSFSPAALANKTVFRIGAGATYGPGQTEDQIQPEANDRVSRTFTSGRVYPIVPATDVYANFDINSPTLGYQPRAYAANYAIPERVTTYTASIQQELPGDLQFLVAYVGSAGRNLFLRSITNLITGVTTNPTTGVGVTTRQFGGRFAEIDYKTSGGTSRYDSLQSSLQRRFAHGLSLGAQYTWAKELGTSSGANEATTAQNPFNFRTEYGRNTYDVRNSFNATVLYDSPLGKGRAYNLHGPADFLLGGYQVGGILNFRSGVPIDVLITRPDIAYVGNAGTAVAGQVFANPVVTAGVVQTTAVVNVPGGGNTRNIRRPNVVPGVNPYLRNRFQYLNPAAFSTPAPGTFGHARRNDLQGPVLSQLDLTLSKNFKATERFSVKFEGDVYNVLNHPNYASPGTVRLPQTLATAPGTGAQPGTPYSIANAGTFGQLSQTVNNQVGIGDNRQIQLSLRAIF